MPVMHQMRRHPVRRAFTLVEVLVVLAVMAIVAAMVVPSIVAAEEFNVQAATRRIVGDIAYAQNDAVARRAVRHVVFESDENRYRLTDSLDVPLPAPWLGGDYRVDFDEDRAYSGVTLEGVNFGGQPVLTFDEMGAPVSGGWLELIAAEKRYRITVSAFSGRVTVADASGG